MSRTILGHTVHRTEDRPHLTGEARYLDDLPGEGHLHAVFVRSPIAHAEIGSIDTSEAARMPGVHAVYTNADLGLEPAAVMRQPALARPMLAEGRVRFVGEAVAVVIAETRAQAVDAAEAVEVDYDPLSAVTDPLAAMQEGAPILFPDHGSNTVTDRPLEDEPDFFDDAETVITERFVIHRVAPVPLEPNGLLAVPEDDGGLRVWASTQSVFGVRGEIARALDLDNDAVRVSAPAIGGGFGAKGGTYPEQIIVAAAAKRLGRAVRWMETRSENMLAMTHGRGQVQDVEIGVKRDGTITGLRARVVAEAGAYASRAFVPMVTRVMASGAYRIPKIRFSIAIVCTNASPTGPYRGAGRPEAAALVERSVDLVARELDLDPAEVRRRNFIPPDAFPYTTPTRATYDSGNYERALDEATRVVGYEDLRREQAARRERGDRHQLGVGIASYVEISGMGSEYGSVSVSDDGSVTVTSGTVPHGQGHETAWAQIASSVLGVPMESVRVVHSDTGRVPRGTGTFGSRSLQLGGSAVHRASEEVLEQARRLAAELLEADPGDIDLFDDGRVGVRGVPDTGLGWAELARAAAERRTSGDPFDGLRAELDFEQQGTFPFGTHIAVVEVDTETGLTRPIRFVAVDDCGKVLNPQLAAGQVHGGVAQGIAQVLYEEAAYDDDGNPLTGSLLTYGVPSAYELPALEVAHTETPTPNNPLGAKGIGESGTTGALAATWNAVVDALAPYGIRHLDLPLTPERIWRAIHGPR